MKLRLHRHTLHDTCTIGNLFVNGVFQCHTLEDTVREVPGSPVASWKIPGKTAIPAGTYPITITHSPRFKRLLPLVGNVPGFEGIRIHPGNTDADTEGCILPGKWDGGTRVNSSADAFTALIRRLNEAIQASEPITIEITNP